MEEEEEVQDDRLNGHESGRLHISVEETIDAINEDASSTKNAVNSAIRSLATYASERLASDDQTLDTISKFDLQTSYAPPKTDTKAIENWCQQLVSFRTSQTKARMEVIYRSALAEAAEGNVDTMPETELLQEKEALESELHTLREEIASVAGMVIENELRKPIVTAMERSESERVRSRREWLDYISFSFGYIIARLDSLELCASELTAFRAALNEIERAFEQNRRGDDPENIASSRAKEKHVNTGRTDAPRLVRKGSAPVEEDELPRLLRTLDLELPRNTNQTPDSYIASKLASRSARLQAQLSAAELSTLQTLGEYLQFQDSNVQAALNALYANTPYGSKCLSNPLLGAEVEHLESVISDAGSSISAVEGRQGEAELVGLRNIRTKWNR